MIKAALSYAKKAAKKHRLPKETVLRKP